jgi:hypothetical protein
MSTGTPVPYFPAPPAGYDRVYMAQVIRAFAVFAQQVNNPGPIRATTLTLNPSGAKIPAGELSYNTAEDTIDLTHLHGVTQQIGFETYMRCRNGTGVTIPDGTVVRFAGVNAEIDVSPYIADGSVQELYFVGVTTFDMADQDVGPVTLYGKVRGLNTTGAPVGQTWVAGDILYASPTVLGGFTKVRPTAPNTVIAVAAVLTVSATVGEIMVRPTIPIGLNYGTFSSTADQTLAATNTATPITYTTTEISNGVTLGSPASRIVVADSGFYHIAVSVQLTSTNASAKNVFFWLAKNGTAVPDTTRALTKRESNAYSTLATTYDLSLQASDYIEIMWAADSTNVRLDAVAASAFAPSAPSVLVVVTQVQL